MKRIAILGGGISGLAAAYELEQRRRHGADLDWHLYEASPRLGGIVETTRHALPSGELVLEGGPDGWVSDKPWLRELISELGLECDLIASNDATRRTWLALHGQLLPLPDAMRMMVPDGLAALENLTGSPLFSPAAQAAYRAEPGRADELRRFAASRDARASDASSDESVATFVARHFGDEVLERVAAPLLSGVFGGDVHQLSVQAVMAPFVRMEREHGSLILALEHQRRERGDRPRPPIFTSLRHGLGSLVEALVARLPSDRLHLGRRVTALRREGGLWCVRTASSASSPDDPAARRPAKRHFQRVVLATSLDATRTLLAPLDPDAAALLPADASSAVLAAFAWPARSPSAPPFELPPGFGFLVPAQPHDRPTPAHSTPAPALLGAHSLDPGPWHIGPHPPLLAATFVDQKFPHRAPVGWHILRAFFGSGSAEHFASATDAEVATAALAQLRLHLGPLPDPDPSLTTVRRWPRSLPQYHVGHLHRMDALDARLATSPALAHLTLLGNAYRGVGLPDLVRAARQMPWLAEAAPAAAD